MELRIKNTRLTIKILSWIQIVGGIYGIGVVSWLTINLEEVNGAILFIVMFGYSLFAFSIISGSKLFNSKTLRLGIILSIINHGLQIIQFKISGYALTYISGSSLSIGIEEGLKIDFSIISSSFNMAINTENYDFMFKINLIAIIIIAILLDIWNEKYNEEEKEEVYQKTSS